MTKRVFISYRRDDTAPAAGRLYDRFRHLLGPKNVFLDVGNIDAGDDFEAKINHEIGKADVILVLVGKRWVEVAPGAEKPRLFNKGDHVHFEVHTALQGNALTLPILVDGARMPEPDSLPEDIAEISKINAPPLRYETFDADADHIARKALGLPAGALLWEEPSLTRKIVSAIAGGLLAEFGLLAAAAIHLAALKRPLFGYGESGPVYTEALVAGVLIAGLILGLLYGSRRRSLI